MANSGTQQQPLSAINRFSSASGAVSGPVVNMTQISKQDEVLWRISRNSRRLRGGQDANGAINLAKVGRSDSLKALLTRYGIIPIHVHCDPALLDAGVPGSPGHRDHRDHGGRGDDHVRGGRPRSGRDLRLLGAARACHHRPSGHGQPERRWPHPGHRSVVPVWAIILIVVLVVLAVGGGFGYRR